MWQANFVAVWWNLWFENFTSDQRLNALLFELKLLLTDYSPDVLCLQECLTRETQSDRLLELLRERGYVTRFDTMRVRGDGTRFGLLIAVRGADWTILPTAALGGSHGTRTLVQAAGRRNDGIRIGNTHWLMPRAQFEFARFRSMKRFLRWLNDGPITFAGGDLNSFGLHPWLFYLARHAFVLGPKLGATWRWRARSRIISARLDYVVSNEQTDGRFVLRLIPSSASDHSAVVLSYRA